MKSIECTNLLKWIARRGVYAALSVSLFVTPGCVSSSGVPESRRAPAHQKLLLRAYAKGVQIYRCERNPKDPTQFVWAIKGPEALLFNECGTVIGSHYAGPTWESDLDGSTVVGAVLERHQTRDTNAILLRAKPAKGTGLLHLVTYIQCSNTIGGQAPTTLPGAAHLGEETRVHFTARYDFYRENGF